MNLFFMLCTVIITLPSLYLRFAGGHLSPVLQATLFGLGILGAAFLLSWAAEVAQVEISRGLALAILALIAILPEYAVDLYFAWVAAYEPIYASYATANMTGANRLLVGAGWPFIVLLFYLRERNQSLRLHRSNRIELSFLGIATVYAFIIPFRGFLGLFDCVVLVTIFALYAWRTAIQGPEEPELVGPAHMISKLPSHLRRTVNLFLFVFAGVVIFVAAEPFAESLLETGEVLGIDEFILVQWLAPLASEAPEFIIAAIWTMRKQAVAAMSALISSKVNQWTLLVGTIPLVYSISLGEVGSLSLDLRQKEEIFLTAAQSIFAVLILIDLKIHLWEAGALFVLFFAQMIFPDIRAEVSIVYLVLSALLIFKHRSRILMTLREGVLPGKLKEKG